MHSLSSPTITLPSIEGKLTPGKEPSCACNLTRKMTPEEAQARIYGILQTHDIPLTKEDLSWAFTQDKTAAEVIGYTERYLGEECFLGLEEAEMYAPHFIDIHS